MSDVITAGAERAAYLLAPSAYRHHDWFARERAGLFTTRWTLVADESELAEPGSYVAVTLGDAPVLVVRGDDGTLRAFHNICRHRGMVMLAEGTGTCPGSISCFYHQWRFGLDGALVGVPQRRDQFPDLDPTQCGLLPASVEVWEGMVFAHPDPAAGPLSDVIAPLATNLGSHRPGQLPLVARYDFDAACNWKLFVENHIDVYHLWYLHEQTLGAFKHTRFEHHFEGDDWFSYEPLRRPRDPAVAATTTEIRHLDDRDRGGIGAHLVFPNLLVATSAQFFATYQAVPLAPDRIRIELRVRAEADADPEVVLAATKAFIDEDILACEQIQRAVNSPAFAVGPLAATHEAPITHFHQSILRQLGGTA